ncbi:MAG TPA: condensation domain-containing protein, partial [Thermoanaerobaculia bacterium]
LVVLNSVAQYFPGVDYLVRVLEGAVRTVAARAGGGAVFVGDVRSLPLLEALHTSVELHRAEPSLAVSELRRRVRRRAANEEELVVDPGLFFALAQRLSEIRRVEILLKRGRHHNELTRFRYDVILHIGGPEEQREAPVLPWTGWREEGLSLSDLERLLAGSDPDALALTGIPNSRLATEGTALALLSGPGRDSETVADLREAIAERLSRLDRAGEAVDPEEIWALGERLGYAVEVTWAGRDGAREGRLAVVLRRRGIDAAAPVSLPAAQAPLRPWSAYANDPLRGRVARRLVPELRHFLQSELPEYMVPSSILLLDSLPLTPHGKVDRDALPAPESLRTDGDGFVAPRTPTEEALAGIWADLLGVERVGATDHFFELGGHSLLATQAVSRVRDRFGAELPVRTLFESPTLGALAERIDAGRHGRWTAMPLLRRRRRGNAPPSFAQARFWFLDRLEPGSPAYNLPSAVRIEGRLDLRALAATFDEILRRHEVLRTSFASGPDGLLQEIAPELRLALPVIDLRALPKEVRVPAARALARDEARRPFDLARAPLLRVLLLALDAETHEVVLTLHHIVSDGWSIGVFVRELAALYAAFLEGRPSPLPELPIQYADFAEWQRELLQGETLAAQIGWWRERLAGAPPVLSLPTDRPRPAVQRFRGATQFEWLPARFGNGIQDLGWSTGATPFMAVLAAFAALLARYSGQQDVVVGSPIAGRTHSETEPLIGLFLNTLALRADLSGAPSFRELVRQVRDTTLAAYAHQDLPFEKLVEELAPERDLGHAPI